MKFHTSQGHVINKPIEIQEIKIEPQSEEDEPVADEAFDYSFENERLHRLRLQDLIWREAGHFRPSCLPVAPSRGGGSSRSSRRKDP